MVNNFLIYLLYLFYGLIFFTLGVSITSRDTSFSKFKFARFLWLLAAFAYIHAAHEWFEIFFIYHLNKFPADLLPKIILAKLLLTLVSFVFLIAFGIGMLSLVVKGRRYLYLLIPLFLAAIAALSLTVEEYALSPAFLRSADIRIRNFIAFPGALFAGIGFIFYSRKIRPGRKGSVNLNAAGVAMLLYGLFTGLIPSGTFLPLLGVPVELLRAISAFFVLYFTMSALHLFDVEWKMIMEERLDRFAQSEKFNAIGKLAAGIAHEINNPLANIQMNVELLKGDLAAMTAPESLDKRLAGIERNVERASKIARELLVFSRETEAERLPTEIRDVIESTLLLLGPRLDGYRLVREYGETPPILAVPWKLEEVFLNVMINALEAMPVGGLLSVRTFSRDGCVVVEIGDSGSGIAPENLRLIFDPFFTTKEVGQGTGLGLSICFGIMASHGGKIEAESAVGKGTTMILTFPVGAPSHA